jgi:hypothetical protein
LSAGAVQTACREAWQRSGLSKSVTEKGLITFAAAGRLCSPAFPRRVADETFSATKPRPATVPFENSGLKRHLNEFHTLGQMRHPVRFGGWLRNSRSMGVSLPVTELRRFRRFDPESRVSL